MKITVLTMFPDSFSSFLDTPVVRRVIEKGILDFSIVDIKEYAGGSYRHIDDSPCGGGKGMLIRFDTLMRALESVRTPSSHTVLLSPKGYVYDQRKAREYAAMDEIILVAGHYEGVDARFEGHVDEMVSLGDYILTGGELGAMCITDSIARLLRGALREGATEDESHEKGLLEYPQYTKPVDYMGEKVPPVLLSGNRREIEKWKKVQALRETRKRRPDLFQAYIMDSEEERLLMESDREEGNGDYS